MFNQVLGMVELRVGTAKAPASVALRPGCLLQAMRLGDQFCNSSIISITVDKLWPQSFEFFLPCGIKAPQKRKAPQKNS